MAGTAPKPFFFAMGKESGIASLSQLENESLYTLINNTEEMIRALAWFQENYKAKGLRTAVVDTVTLFGRMAQMELTDYGRQTMEHRHWMKFLSYFLNIRDCLHSCDVHVIWVFHDDEVKSGDLVMKRAPKLAGQALKEILQTCGIIAYMDKIELSAKKDENGNIVAPAETVRRFFTKCPEEFKPPFEAGTWYDQVLTHGCYYPSFQALAKFLSPETGRKHITV